MSETKSNDAPKPGGEPSGFSKFTSALMQLTIAKAIVRGGEWVIKTVAD